MRKLSATLIAAALLGSSLSAIGQTGLAPNAYSIRSNSGTVTIPFSDDSGHIVIQVEVNGKPLDLILDTGMPMDGALLFGGPHLDDLGLKSDQEIMIGGPDGGTVPAGFTPESVIAVGDLQLSHQPLVVMPADPDRNSTFVREGMYGVIGLGLFGRFVVGIDFDRHEVTLTEPDRFVYRGSGEEIPMSLRGPFPYVACKGEMHDGTIMPLELVFDIGHRMPLSLNVTSHESISLPGSAIETRIGTGVTGEHRGHMGRIRALYFGKYRLVEPVTTYPSNPGRTFEINGNVGLGASGRFNMAIDFGKQRLIVEPNKRFAEPFEYEMTGILWSRNEEGFVSIDRVIHDSPAADADLLAGDVISRIDKLPSSEWTTAEIRRHFKRDGATLDLTVQRDGNEHSVELELKRLI
jgi:hypothetical protein